VQRFLQYAGYHLAIERWVSKYYIEGRWDVRIPDRPVFGSDVKSFVVGILGRPFPITLPCYKINQQPVHSNSNIFTETILTSQALPIRLLLRTA
jgi:hypothetical protein